MARVIHCFTSLPAWLQAAAVILAGIALVTVYAYWDTIWRGRS